MITVSLSLALCTIMFRRFMDSFTGRVPIPVQTGFTPNTTAIFMLSGALYYLYKHLKKGTIVSIGQGHPRHLMYSSSNRLQIQRRPRNNSWFLRNARACRKKCTDAMYKIAKQSYDSLHSLNPCLLLPNKSFQICFTKVKSDSNLDKIRNHDEKKKICNIIYNNETFSKDSSQDVKSSEMKSCALQTTDLSMGENVPVVTRRKRRSGLLKRLGEGSRSRDDLSCASLQKKNKIKRMTRSGRVYSRFE